MIASILIGGVVLYTLPHLLIRTGYAEARDSSGKFSKVSIYRATSGDAVFYIEDSDESEVCYVVNIPAKRLSIPSCSSQVTRFGILAFSNESPIPGVESTDRIKVEKDLEVVINEEAIEFNDLSGRRIIARRPSF